MAEKDREVWGDWRRIFAGFRILRMRPTFRQTQIRFPEMDEKKKCVDTTSTHRTVFWGIFWNGLRERICNLDHAEGAQS
jgi:hypothetical protein